MKSFIKYLLTDDKELIVLAVVIFFVAGLLSFLIGSVVLGVMCLSVVKVVSFLTYLAWKKHQKQNK